MNRLFHFFAGVMVAMASGCNCTQDITNDPTEKFGNVKDHPFATRKVMLAYGGKDPATNQELYEISVAGETSSGDMPIAIMPIGTIICPVRATTEVCESGATTTYVQIETGDFAGKQGRLWYDSSLFLQPGPSYGGKKQVWQWEANPDYLTPVGRQ